MDTKENDDIKVSRLSTVCDPLLKEDIGLLDCEQIQIEGFVESINDKSCVIRFGRDTFREIIFLSFFMGFLLGFCFFINDYVKTWKGNERFHLEMVTIAKKRYGDEFHLNPKLPERFKVYEYISDSKSISLLQYFYIRYTDSGFYEKSKVRSNLLLDGVFFLFFLIVNSICLYFLFFFRKLSPFIINREKQIFYTWAKGKMYIARYAQLEVVHSKNILLLRTYNFDENNNLFIHTFRPRIPNIYSSWLGKAYLLTFMAKYLIQGKGAVSSVDFQRQRTLFASLFVLRQEPKPIDWETQIEDILVKLDKIMPPNVSQADEISEDKI